MIDADKSEYQISIDDLNNLLDEHYIKTDRAVKLLCESIIKEGIDRAYATILILVSVNKAALNITGDKNTFLEFLALAQLFSTIVDDSNNSEESDINSNKQSLGDIDLLNIKTKGGVH